MYAYLRCYLCFLARGYRYSAVSVLRQSLFVSRSLAERCSRVLIRQQKLRRHPIGDLPSATAKQSPAMRLFCPAVPPAGERAGPGSLSDWLAGPGPFRAAAERRVMAQLGPGPPPPAAERESRHQWTAPRRRPVRAAANLGARR